MLYEVKAVMYNKTEKIQICLMRKQLFHSNKYMQLTSGVSAHKKACL